MNLTMLNDRNKKKIIWMVWLHSHKFQKQAKLNYITQEMHTEKVKKKKLERSDYYKTRREDISREDEKGYYWEGSQEWQVLSLIPLLWEVIILLFVLFLVLVG